MRCAHVLHVGLLAVMILGACNRGSPFGPDNQPEFSNDTNLFQWRATSMQNIKEGLLRISQGIKKL